jgi:HSP20 family protein
MRLRRWQPLGDIVRFMDGFNDGFFKDPDFDSNSMAVASWSPHIDIHEDENEYVFRAELPGMDKKDVNVEIENDQLIISGEKVYRQELKEENFHRVESSSGKFYRSFRLPKTVNQEKIKAVMEKGILELKIPKAEDKKRKKIPVIVN